jgi:carbamoyltransferase
MNIVGLSFYYHDSAAALIADGKIIAASSEERFSRLKHDSGFPKKAIDFCLKSANIPKNQIDYAIFYEKPFRKFHRIFMSSLSTYPKSYTSFREAMLSWLTKKLWIKQEIASYLDIDLDKILFSEHHLSHAAGCFYPSPFQKSAILTVDGVGEWTTASYGIGTGNKITMLKELLFPHSLGLLYSAFTAFLGFEVNEGEWKVMGLAPYGKPIYKKKIEKLIIKHPDGSFSLDMAYFSFHYSDNKSYTDKFISLFGIPVPPQKSHQVSTFSADFASSIQSVTEDLLTDMAKAIKKITGLENLCMSGGVAQNSVANYRILKNSGFKNIYIQPSSGDSGAALGAALYTYHHVLNLDKRKIMDNAYLGKGYTNKEIGEFLIKENIAYKKHSDEKLTDFISSKIIEGKVIGWMQGKSEWGERALGNRSILTDPRNPKMKDIINAKVKFRESFRPFAPSVLAEYADKIFDLSVIKTENSNRFTRHNLGINGKLENIYPLKFMLYVIPVKKEWSKKIPAVNHIDNTARPQIVYKKDNPLFYKLIKAFYLKTGTPLLLNTSFNLKGEPIVESPRDAYSTFIRSGIDILVMGNYVIEKEY